MRALDPGERFRAARDTVWPWIAHQAMSLALGAPSVLGTRQPSSIDGWRRGLAKDDDRLRQCEDGLEVEPALPSSSAVPAGTTLEIPSESVASCQVGLHRGR